MKYHGHKAIAFAVLVSLNSPALAQPVPVWRNGNVRAVYADPSDLVIDFSVVGPCGSRLYHVRRTNTNFREMVEIVLAALPRDSVMGLHVIGCAGGRNIVTHGFVVR